MALCLFILYIHHCQFEADAQMLRCPKWARCSDAVLLDFLMRVSPQIHPCLQSPGPAHDSLCVAAELPIVHESTADCLNSRVIFLVQAISLNLVTSQTLCIPPIELEEPTSLTMAAGCWSDGPHLTDGPHDGPHFSEVAPFLGGEIGPLGQKCLMNHRLITEVATVLSLGITGLSQSQQCGLRGRILIEGSTFPYAWMPFTLKHKVMVWEGVNSHGHIILQPFRHLYLPKGK